MNKEEQIQLMHRLYDGGLITSEELKETVDKIYALQDDSECKEYLRKVVNNFIGREEAYQNELLTKEEQP